MGQPILAAAGFQPALTGSEGSRMARESRLKGGCRQDCLPHNGLSCLLCQVSLQIAQRIADLAQGRIPIARLGDLGQHLFVNAYK